MPEIISLTALLMANVVEEQPTSISYAYPSIPSSFCISMATDG